jgi:N-acetylglucosamine malate deacetylase 2
VLGAFAEHGARVSLLCLTHGEASTLHEAPGELRRVREAELVAAADILGLSHVELASYPDGALAAFGTSLLDDVDRAARARGADGFVVFHRSGVTGHPDHVAATAAALQVADRLGLPVLEWTLPASVAEQLNTELGTSFTGDEPGDIDLVLPVDRARQRRAIAAHASQAAPSSPLWRRLRLLGGHEYLRLSSWLA